MAFKRTERANPAFSTGFSTGVENSGRRPNSIPDVRVRSLPMSVRCQANPGARGERDFSTTACRGVSRVRRPAPSLTRNLVAVSIVGSVVAIFHLFLRNFDETYVPTEPAPPPAHAWLPGAHANQKRPYRSQAPPRQ